MVVSGKHIDGGYYYTRERRWPYGAAVDAREDTERGGKVAEEGQEGASISQRQKDGDRGGEGGECYDDHDLNSEIWFTPAKIPMGEMLARSGIVRHTNT